MIRGNIEQRKIFELFFPVGEFLLHRRALGLLALPHRVVSVLNAQFRQNRFGASRIGLIDQPQLVREESNRDVIDDRMVRRHQHHMLAVFDAQQCDAEQRPRGQIETPAGFLER